MELYDVWRWREQANVPMGDAVTISRRRFDAVIFDLDGVVTRTATVHAAAWKRLFDEYLKERAAREGKTFRTFNADTDYRRYVDGKPRYDGVAGFLESRGVSVPYGKPTDSPDRDTVCGLGNRKNRYFTQHLAEHGVAVYESTVSLIRHLRARGMKTAIFSASKNCEAILKAADLTELFNAKVDGVEADEMGLPGKPDPAVLLEAARRLEVGPARAVIIEDAIAGVRAGRSGRFGLVIGVNRSTEAGALQRNGADIEVADLDEVTVADEGSAAEADLNKRWWFVCEGFVPDQEKLRETLCTLGNGYFATRGAAPEADADDIHYPGTYLAGGYNRLSSEIDGHMIEVEDLINLPNWLSLTVRIEGGKWFDLRKVEILEFRQELNLKHGILLRIVRFRDSEGRRTALESRRFVHMASAHLAGLETTLTPEDWTGRLEIRSALDGRVVNAGVERYLQLSKKHLIPLETGSVGKDGIWLSVQASQSRIEIAQAARTRVFVDGEAVEANGSPIREPGYIAQTFACDVQAGREVTIEKIVSLLTSRDRGVSESGLEARSAIERAGRFGDLLQIHAISWEHLWRRCDIQVADDERTQLILRLHVFHLLQTASLNTIDLDVGVPARGWHGEAYRGHILWDELFILPFLNFCLPDTSRALICYRHRRLSEARWAARQAGYRGAMYPWQSGSDGREESQRLHLNPLSGRWIPDNSHLQRHINAAIVYNIWRYYQVTDDAEFLHFYGAEMLVEIARFWASLASYNAELDRYEILGVMGPDEYHDAYPYAAAPGVNNNGYTNIMAVWVLCRALEVLDMVPGELRQALWENLQIQQEEIALWEEISRKMRVVYHDDGIISQFEGYDRLQEFDWDGYRRKYGDIQRLDRILEAEGDSPNRYKASKQADVVMLFYLFSADELRGLFERLGYPFEYETIPKNIDYYCQRTSHGSSLSRMVHSWVLARSDRAASWSLFKEALESDIADIQGGTAPEGIHLGAMAGTADLVQRGYTGMEVRGDALWLNPCLPDDLRGLLLRLRFRKHWLEVEVSGDCLRASTSEDAPGPMRLGFKDQIYELEPGDTREFAL
jgi:beta-phosphoglucomutase family hydrolase